MSEAGNWTGGGCCCGAVRYAIDRGAIAGQAHCACTDCKRATGSAFATFCFVPEPAFRAEQGEPKGFTVQGSSGGDVTRYFCPDCGAQLYSEVAVMPGVRFVKAGSLDDASWMSPEAAFWCDSLDTWAAFPEGVTRHAMNPS